MLRLICRRAGSLEHYQVLELKPGATEQEIKAAYAKLAMLYHPDTTAFKDKKEATEKFHKITEAKDALLNETPGQAAPLSARQAYEEFKKRQGQTWEENWQERQEWRQKQREQKRKETDSEWKGPKREAEKTTGNDLVFWSLLGIAGMYLYTLLYPPRPPPKMRNVKDPKPEVKIGLKDVYSRRVHKHEPFEDKIFSFQGRIGAHTNFRKMTNEPASPESLYKCCTCNAIVAKKFIKQHVEENAYKHTI